MTANERIQLVRDEFSRLRAHLFEAAEAAGWPRRQENGWKGVIRTITYDSQTSIEAALRRESEQLNGGTMAEPGVTAAHVQAAYRAEYPSHQPEPEEAPEGAQQAEAQQAEVEEVEG